MVKPLVSSFSIALKKATTVSEDAKEAKMEHRVHLKDLVDRYKTDVISGKAEGIRTAKELVEVIKLDLLLMGEATERTDNANPIDEAQVVRMTQMLDENSPEVQALMESMFGALNGANDDLDLTPVHHEDTKASVTEEDTAVEAEENIISKEE